MTHTWGFAGCIVPWNMAGHGNKMSTEGGNEEGKRRVRATGNGQRGFSVG